MLNIKELRIRQGITQLQLSEKMGITQATVALWESGDNYPRADKLPEIARVLRCTVNDLFLENNDRQKGA